MTKAKLEIVPEEIKFLREVVEASESGSVLYSNPLNHVALLDAKLIEISMSLVNDEGCVATRATRKAVEYLSNIPLVELPALPDEEVEAQTIEVLPASALKSRYALVSTVPVPESKRGGKGCQSQWPFGTMEVGQSFFIPDGANFEAAKKYASTVSSATGRFNVPVEGATRITRKGVVVPKTRQTRAFIIRAATGDGWGQPGVKGAGVWRTK